MGLLGLSLAFGAAPSESLAQTGDGGMRTEREDDGMDWGWLGLLGLLGLTGMRRKDREDRR